MVMALSIPGVSAATVRELYEQAVDAYNKQDFEQAVDFYQQTIKMAPNFAPAYIGMGLALKSKNADTDEVLYYYKTAVEMDPTNTQALEQLGRLYHSMNQLDKAERVFLKALKIDPGLGSIKLSLAWIYLSGRPKPELAIKYFKETLQSSKSPELYYGLGMAYFANNSRVEAMDMITQLKKMGQDDYAKRLEQAVRENRKVVIEQTPETPPSPTEEKASPTDTGIKVRLRGKLSDL